MGHRIWFGVTIVVAATCFALSAWQFGRRADRVAANRAALLARDLPPLDLNAADPGGSVAGRRGVVRGILDHPHTVILRGHLLDGAPGTQVVTPLRLEGSEGAILVHRGFVPAGDATVPDVQIPAPEGVVEFSGTLMLLPRTEDGGQPVAHRGDTTWRRLDRDAMARRLPYRLSEYYLLAAPDSLHAGWPRRLVPPPLDEGPHLSYAIQWIGIGLAVLAFGLVFVLGVGRHTGGPAVPPPPP